MNIKWKWKLLPSFFLCLLFIYNYSVIAFCKHLFILSLLGFSHIFTIQKFCQSSHFITLIFSLGYQNYVLVEGGWDALCVQYTPKIPFFSLSPKIRDERVCSQAIEKNQPQQSCNLRYYRISYEELRLINSSYEV